MTSKHNQIHMPSKMGAHQNRSDPPLSIKMVSAGLAGCFAEMVTFPIDVAKVRLQVQGEGSSRGTQTFRYRGMMGTILTVAREEGPRALYSGLAPGLQRQICFCTVRLGFYDSVRNSYVQLLGGDKDKPHVLQRILAGITTGGLAVISAQPTDVVKVRMQAQSSGVKRYDGCLQAYRHIAKHEGIKGLWKGLLPSVTRNAVVNAGELVSYDLIKMKFISSGLLSDNMPCHFLSAFGAGFFTTLLASPIDVVKTRFMNSSSGTYSGALNCAYLMYKEGGLKAFYKGFVPSFMRLGSWNIVMFVCFEQLKRGFMGLSYFKDQVGPVEQALKQNKLKIDTY